MQVTGDLLLEVDEPTLDVRRSQIPVDPKEFKRLRAGNSSVQCQGTLVLTLDISKTIANDLPLK